MRVGPLSQEQLPLLDSTLRQAGRRIDHAKRLTRQARGRCLYLVAWQGQTPLGHVILNWDSDTEGEPEAVRALHIPRVEDLWTMPDFRRRGVAQMLMSEVESLAKAKGFTRIGLDVAPDNQAALELYSRRGYVNLGIPQYRIGGVNVVDGQAYPWSERCIFLVKDL